MSNGDVLTLKYILYYRVSVRPFIMPILWSVLLGWKSEKASIFGFAFRTTHLHTDREREKNTGNTCI